MPPLPTIPALPAAPPPTDAINAFMVHNWFAFAAIILMLFIQVLKQQEAKWWTATPNGVRFLWPLGLGAIAAFVHAFVAGEALHAALWDTLNSVWQIALPAMGGAALLKESPLPWDGGAGGIPKPAPLSALPSISAPVIPISSSPANDLTPAEDDRLTPVDATVRPPPPSSPPPAA